MLIRENSLNITEYPIYDEKIKTYLKNDFLILDIETTGFHRKYSKIILIGMIYKNNDQYKFIQIFAETLDEEKQLLLAFNNFIDNFGEFFYITYNGHAFDLPFINAKFNEHNMNCHLNLGQNLDLYRVIRKNKNKLGLDRYNLKSVEKHLGIHREDQISGKESIQLYYDYIKTREESIRKNILLHNAEDIEYLWPLIQIFNYIDYKNIIEYLPKRILSGYYLSEYKVQKDFLLIAIDASQAKNYSIYESLYTIEYKKHQLQLKLPIQRMTLNNTHYILLNHRLIYNKPFKNLTGNEKNALVIKIDDKFIIERLIPNLQKILKNKLQ